MQEKIVVTKHFNRFQIKVEKGTFMCMRFMILEQDI